MADSDLVNDDSTGAIPGKCRECLGCILCGEVQCPFYSDANPEACYVEKCTYCHRFLRIQRLFLNNVG